MSLSDKSSCIEIRNHLNAAATDDIAREIHLGLTSSQKYLPSKYFYDSRGSKLFEEICRLPEYYLTRTEIGLLTDAAPHIMKSFNGGDLVELGSGANWKIRMLIDAAIDNGTREIRYVPFDVSESALKSAADELLKLYPGLEVMGIVADFFHHLEAMPDDRPKIIIFFGSTIGNLNEDESRQFLKNIASTKKPGDRFLLGIDMVKSKERLEDAYNDSMGITSEFNKNILNVLNSKLNADFNTSHFDHIAFFNEDKERVEMHLQTNRDVSVNIADLDLNIALMKGETIHTEICRKFSKEKIEHMISESGFDINHWYSDTKEWFSLLDLSLK